MGGSEFSVFDDRSVLVTGGTGSFGQRFVKELLDRDRISRVVVFSRDELKQFHMAEALRENGRVRFFLGDIRDKERLYRAFDGVDIVIHAAALKQIPAAEYNPFEFVKTNIIGSENIIDVAIDRRVSKVLALSTDKASSPVNLYGATKLVGDKLFVAGNAYTGTKNTRFAVVRYGNVMGSRGSVVDKLRRLGPGEAFNLTDPRMTRFWITPDRAAGFVASCVAEMQGGEIFVPKLPSMRLTDLISTIAPDVPTEVIGLRPGEKLHEEMISLDEARRTLDRGDHYCIAPEISWRDQKSIDGQPVPEGFRYASDSNDQWLDPDHLRTLLDD